MRENRRLLVLVVAVSVNSVFGSIINHDKTLYEGSACQTADKRSGTCNLKCPTLTVSQLLDRDNICGFKKGAVIFCCPKVLFDESVKYPTIEQACIDSKQRKEERIQTSEEVKRRILDEEKEYKAFSKEYLNIVPTKNKKNILDCEEEAKKIDGKGQQNYVKWCKSLFIHHNAISSTSFYIDYPNKFPHIAAIGVYQNEKEDAPVSWICTGTLIHRSFVVTSASCILSKNPVQIVRVGAIDLLEGKRGAYDVDYSIEKVFVNEQYKPGEYQNDIALLKIRRIIEGKRSFVPPLPACILTQPNYNSEEVHTMGYGAPNFQSTYETKLHTTNLTSSHRCLHFYNLDSHYLSKISTTEICVGNCEKEDSHCKDTFGEPLLINGDDERTTPYLVGISSAGPLCCNRKPEMATKLHDNLQWIEDILSLHR